MRDNYQMKVTIEIDQEGELIVTHNGKPSRLSKSLRLLMRYEEDIKQIIYRTVHKVKSEDNEQ